MFRKKLIFILVLFIVCFFSNMVATAAKSLGFENPRVQWMKGKYGIMVHWVLPVQPRSGEYLEEWDQIVNGFDLDGFMADFDKTGAEWLIFTITHSANGGLYASPNSIIDSLGGPGHTSQRDLIMEIARALKQRGKKFIAYLPLSVKSQDLQKSFSWNSEPGTDQAKFQEKYLLAIHEWAVRYGKLLDGWWFDGCYYQEPFHNKHMKWEKWYAACRAGNENAVMAFNDGGFTQEIRSPKPIVPEHDYLSGEAVVLIDGKIRSGNNDNKRFFMPETAYVENTNCLQHVLVPIDVFWWHGVADFPDWAKAPFSIKAPSRQKDMELPLYSDSDLQKFVHDFTSVGGAVTVNVGIFQEGYLGKETIRHLQKLKKTFKK